jgi:hypothetical protein
MSYAAGRDLSVSTRGLPTLHAQSASAVCHHSHTSRGLNVCLDLQLHQIHFLSASKSEETNTRTLFLLPNLLGQIGNLLRLTLKMSNIENITPTRVGSQETAVHISAAQKQALIDNLQLEGEHAGLCFTSRC